MNAKFHWLSLGENCLADRILLRHGLKSFNTPFSNGRTNIDYILDCEREAYAGLLNPANLARSEYQNATVVRSTRFIYSDPIFAAEVSNGFEFTHHDVIDDAEHIDSFRRKIERQGDIRRLGWNTVYLYHHRWTKAPNIAALVSKLQAFQSLYSERPRQRCVILLLSQELIEPRRESSMTIDRVSHDLTHYRIRTPNLWSGNGDNFWALKEDHLIRAMLDDARSLLTPSLSAA